MIHYVICGNLYVIRHSVNGVIAFGHNIELVEADFWRGGNVKFNAVVRINNKAGKFFFIVKII